MKNNNDRKVNLSIGLSLNGRKSVDFRRRQLIMMAFLSQHPNEIHAPKQGERKERDRGGTVGIHFVEMMKSRPKIPETKVCDLYSCANEMSEPSDLVASP